MKFHFLKISWNILWNFIFLGGGEVLFFCCFHCWIFGISWCRFGDSVNTASRMQSHGEGMFYIRAHGLIFWCHFFFLFFLFFFFFFSFFLFFFFSFFSFFLFSFFLFFFFLFSSFFSFFLFFFVADKIHLSESTAQLLREVGGFIVEERGEMQIKVLPQSFSAKLFHKNQDKISFLKKWFQICFFSREKDWWQRTGYLGNGRENKKVISCDALVIAVVFRWYR